MVVVSTHFIRLICNRIVVNVCNPYEVLQQILQHNRTIVILMMSLISFDKYDEHHDKMKLIRKYMLNIFTVLSNAFMEK